MRSGKILTTLKLLLMTAVVLANVISEASTCTDLENKKNQGTVISGFGGSCLVLRKPGIADADPFDGDTLFVTGNGQIKRIGPIALHAVPTARGALTMRLGSSPTEYEIYYWDATSEKEKICSVGPKDRISVSDLSNRKVSITSGQGLLRVTREQVGKDFVEDCSPKGNVKVYLELDKNDRKVLEEFGSGGQTNELTNPAVTATYPTIVGRDDEVNKIMANLQMGDIRSTIIIGKPGLGKTTLVYELAKRIVEGKVPESLKGWSIYSIEISKLSDEGFRGKADGKVSRLLDASVGKKVILLFDEMHKLVGKGASSENNSDVTEAMKTPLAEGRLAIIGTTTDDKNEIGLLRLKEAFFQRFHQLYLKELSEAVLVKILRGKANEMEMKHNVAFTDENLAEIIQLTKRYVPDQGHPRIGLKMIQAVAAALAVEKKEPKDKISVNSDDIKNEIGVEANIPSLVTKITAQSCNGTTFKQKVNSFDGEFAKDFVGQKAAIKAVQGSLNSIALNMHDPKRPAGVFLFLGPSGVGKTYFGELLGKTFCMPIKMFAMSKYRDESSVNALTGSDPGYVGYNPAGGELTQWIRENPESVLIFDEIDKANPQVLEALIQLLDDGVFHDKVGNAVKFRNGYIIMTSNFGMDLIEAYDKQILGLKDPREGAFSKPMPHAVPQTAEKLKNEIMNMIEADGKFGSYMSGRVGRENTIVFHHLSQDESKQIAKLEVKKVVKQVSKEIKVTVAPRIEEIIGEESYDFKIGARRARELADKWVRQTMTSALVKNSDKGPFKEVAIVEQLPATATPGVLHAVPEDILSGQFLKREAEKKGVCRAKEFRDLVKDFPEDVRQKYIGQDLAIQSVHTALKRLAVNGAKPGKAAGRFLFVGPSGVGKTYLGELISEMFCLPMKVYPMEMYRSEDAINTFVGAAPGYIGYKENGGGLVQWVKANPNSVLIFDEIDKADPQVLESLMQFLDKGTITDKSGQTAQLQGGMIFLTSNFAMSLIDDFDKVVLGIKDPRHTKLNFDPEKIPKDLETLRSTIFEALAKDQRLGSYMQGRIGRDNIIVFNHFRPEEVKRVAEIEVKKALKEIAPNIKVQLDNSILDLIVSEGFDFMTGARQIRDAAQRIIVDTIADHLMSSSAEQGKKQIHVVLSTRDIQVPESAILLKVNRKK